MDDQVIVLDPAVNRARGDIELFCDCSHSEELLTLLLAITMVRWMPTGLSWDAHHAWPPNACAGARLDRSMWRTTEADIQASMSLFR
jgi:hypothetical protein